MDRDLLSKTEVLEKSYTLGYEYEYKYKCCAQCTIAAIQDVFKLDVNDVFKAGHGLCGGVGGSREGTCGALSGGAMILSYNYGRGRKDFALDMNSFRSWELSKKLYNKFVFEFGSCICREVQKGLFMKTQKLWLKNSIATSVKEVLIRRK